MRNTFIKIKSKPPTPPLLKILAHDRIEHDHLYIEEKHQKLDDNHLNSDGVGEKRKFEYRVWWA